MSNPNPQHDPENVYPDDDFLVINQTKIEKAVNLYPSVFEEVDEYGHTFEYYQDLEFEINREQEQLRGKK